MPSSSRDLMSRLLRRARARIRESPVLRDDYRHERRTDRMSIWKILYYAFFGLASIQALVILPLWLPQLGFLRFGADGVLALHSLLTLLVAHALTFLPRSQLKRSTQLSVMAHVPASDRDVASQVVNQCLAMSTLLIYFNLCFYGVLAWNLPQSINWLAVLPFAVVQWLVCFASTMLLAAWIRERSLAISLYVTMIAIVAFCCLDPANLHDASSIIFSLTPSGWLNGILSNGIIAGSFGAFWAAIPLVAWLLSGLWSQSVLADAYRIHQFVMRNGLPAEAVGIQHATLAVNLAAESLSRLQGVYGDEEADAPALPTPELKRQVRSREFLDKDDWAQLGWIERLVHRYLTVRERAVIDLLTGQQIQWTLLWKGGWSLIPMFFAYSWLFGNLPPELWIFVMVSCFPGTYVGPWPAFRARSCGGVYLSQFAAFPVTRDEASRAMFKVTAIRALGSFCVTLIPCVILTMPLPFWPLEGFLSAIGVAVLSLLLFPWMFCWHTSLGSAFPDWRPRNVLRRALMGGLILIGWFSTQATLMAVMIPGGLQWITVGPGVGVLLLATLWVAYLSRRFYLTGAIDLVRTSPDRWDRFADKHEQAYVQGKRAIELRKKHGWFWWLKRQQQEAETA